MLQNLCCDLTVASRDLGSFLSQVIDDWEAHVERLTPGVGWCNCGDGDSCFKSEPEFTVYKSAESGAFFAANIHYFEFANICQTLEGSFSAVSKQIFTSKSSICSIFQALQDL